MFLMTELLSGTEAAALLYKFFSEKSEEELNFEKDLSELRENLVCLILVLLNSLTQ